jgi:hypothetical protein
MRVAYSSFPRLALSMCGSTHSATAHSADVEQPSCAEPRSKIAAARGRRIKLRLSATVFAAPLGSRKASEGPSRNASLMSRRVSELVDAAFVPVGLRDEPHSEVTSKLNDLFAPSNLRHGSSERNLLAGQSAAPYPALQLDVDHRKRRVHKRRGSEEQGEDSAPCGAGAEDAPSGRLQESAPILQQGRRRMPAPPATVSPWDRTAHFSENAPAPGRFAPDHDHTRELGASGSMSSTPLSEAGRLGSAVSEPSDDSEEVDSHKTTADNPAEHRAGASRVSQIRIPPVGSSN